MSHFTHMKTRFQNLFYLEKAMDRLNIEYERKEQLSPNSNTLVTDLVIPQSNDYDIKFSWTNNQYELIVDLSFWEKLYPVQTFVDRITQQYAVVVIIGESQKIGFQPIKYQQNSDGSNTLTLERWHSVKSNNTYAF